MEGGKAAAEAGAVTPGAGSLQRMSGASFIGIYDTEPAEQSVLNTLKLRWGENSKPTHEISWRERLNPLNQKCAVAKKSCGYDDLKL